MRRMIIVASLIAMLAWPALGVIAQAEPPIAHINRQEVTSGKVTVELSVVEQKAGASGQTAGWYEKTIDLGAYAGQTIVLAFRNYSRFDNFYNTYTYLDNVRLEP